MQVPGRMDVHKFPQLRNQEGFFSLLCIRLRVLPERSGKA
jgi:hypothetical protein